MESRFFLCPCKVWENFKHNFKALFFYLILALLTFLLDQWVKGLILEGARYEGNIISIIYVLNDGVAFSMFAFLGEWLKWIQLGLIVLLGYGVLASKELLRENFFPFALIIGSGASNLYDRFNFGGVVDYIYWHYGFEFAVFNLADVLINIGVGILLIRLLLAKNS